MSDDELAQVLIAVYYPGLSRNSVSFEYLPGLEPVCKSNQENDFDLYQNYCLSHTSYIIILIIIHSKNKWIILN